MNLIIPDLDTNILDNLHHPSVLTMSEVNRYYHKLLKDKIDSLNRYKLNPEYMGNYYPCWAFKWFIETREEKNIRKNTGLFFQQLFEYGNVELAKWMIDFYEKDNYWLDQRVLDLSLFNSCTNNHLDISQWLVKLADEKKIQFYGHLSKDYLFGEVCAKGHINIVKFLITLGETTKYGKIDIHWNNDVAFFYACDLGRMDVMLFLIELGENRYGIVDIESKLSFAFHAIPKICTYEEAITITEYVFAKTVIALSKKYRVLLSQTLYTASILRARYVAAKLI